MPLKICAVLVARGGWLSWTGRPRQCSSAGEKKLLPHPCASFILSIILGRRVDIVGTMRACVLACCWQLHISTLECALVLISQSSSAIPFDPERDLWDWIYERERRMSMDMNSIHGNSDPDCLRPWCFFIQQLFFFTTAEKIAPIIQSGLTADGKNQSERKCGVHRKLCQTNKY